MSARTRTPSASKSRVRDLSGKDRECAVTAFVDWLLGVDARDAAWLHTWNEDGVCLARGAMPGVGYLAALDAPAEAGAERAAFLGHGGVLRPDGLFEKRGGKRGWALKARLFRWRRARKRSSVSPSAGRGAAKKPSKPSKRCANAPRR